jgi:hypothetical protein
MQKLPGSVAAVMITVVVAACGGSTSPAECNASLTTASYVDLESVTGTVTAISFVRGSSTTPASEIIEMAVPGFSVRDTFAIDAETAVFERLGSFAPTATSACQLAVGEQIQSSTGFGDFLPPAGRVSARINSVQSDGQLLHLAQVVILR